MQDENFSMPRWLTGPASLVLLCTACVLATSAREAPLPGSVFRDCARICPEMVALPRGSYLMGSPAEDPHQGKDGEEQPQHRVDIGYAFRRWPLRGHAR
jgi:formylglycine-generating enzyme required for sulfatase activity